MDLNNFVIKLTYLYSTLSNKSRLRASCAKFLTASSLSSSSGGRRASAKPYWVAYGLSPMKAGGSDARREVGTVYKIKYPISI